MEIHEFLKKVIDGYLLHDLENMVTFTPKEGTDGSLGYPIMVSIIAGMELLGALLMTDTVDFSTEGKAGNDYFNNYWDNYFSCVDPKYKAYRSLFRQLIRNGIAHTFVGKPGIFIIKDETAPLISPDQERYKLNVNAVVFYRDFKKSYEERVKPIVEDT